MAITSTEVTIILSVGAVMLAFLRTQHSQPDDVAFCSWSRQRWHERHDEPPARPRRNVGYVSGNGSDDAYQISGPGRPKSVAATSYATSAVGCLVGEQTNRAVRKVREQFQLTAAARHRVKDEADGSGQEGKQHEAGR